MYLIILVYLSIKIYVVGKHKKCLIEAFIMSTHNIFFFENWRKLSQNYHYIFHNKFSVNFLFCR